MKKDYNEIFKKLIQGTEDYLIRNNLHSQILGISGGIDSTVVAAICREVSDRTGISLIGRSLPTKFNKEEETTTADLVGKAFCDDYLSESINIPYNAIRIAFNSREVSAGNSKEYPIANGNIQARLRMIYLYNLASIHGGIVMDTDNLTENNLGYFTIHGDVGDFNPIGGLWKTEIFELAKYLVEFYTERSKTHSRSDLKDKDIKRAEAISFSLNLIPTAGLGITNSDLEELEADSYEQVDAILKNLVKWRKLYDTFLKEKEESLRTWMSVTKNIPELKDIPEEIIKAVSKRHFTSDFKRKHLPIKLEL